MMFFRFLLVFSMLVLQIEAKVTLSVSKVMSHFSEDAPALLRYSKIQIETDEMEVKNTFVKHESKLAIIREDVLADFYSHALDFKKAPYYIIGKISEKSILYFAKYKKSIGTFEEVFSQQRVSLGSLGDLGGRYIKPLLKEKALLYQSSLLSLDAHHSLDALRKKKIDSFFLFAPKEYEKLFAHYLLDYPLELKYHLAEQKSLSCLDTQRYCSISYYLIASDTLGKEVMENIYVQSRPFLAKKKQLVSNLGKYYIYTGLKKTKRVSTVVQKKTNRIHFGRTPWMDTAIEEAIKGKGSAENVFPMLKLSYKYIRFAKGNAGITTAPNDNKEGSWCAAYICWTLSKSGYKVHANGRMASQSFRYFNKKLYRKIERPIFGAITLFTNMKKQTHGHVGYLFGKTKNGKYILLGGNQSNRLKFANYAEHFGSYKLRGFYVPINYKVKAVDYLNKNDIYPSAKMLNKKYGIKTGRDKKTVR